MKMFISNLFPLLYFQCPLGVGHVPWGQGSLLLWAQHPWAPMGDWHQEPLWISQSMKLKSLRQRGDVAAAHLASLSSAHFKSSPDDNVTAM